MSGELKGLENNQPIRMVYIDTKEEVLFKSMASASRKTKISSRVIKDALNPMKFRKFIYEDREVVFRINKV